MRLSYFVLLSLAVRLGAAVSISEYAQTTDGRVVREYTLENKAGVKVVVLDYGAIVTEVHTPDREGRLADITLGYDSMREWETNRGYFGATVGRWAGRIGGGKFSLDGKIHEVARNSGDGEQAVHLHGGRQGFDKKLWSGKVVRRDGLEGVQLEYLSPDGEEGYPGNLRASVTYYVTDANELRIEFSAKTDQPTVVNLTNHAYWNLTGDPRGSILDHELTIKAESFLELSPGLIPTGVKIAVRDSPFDFRKAKRVGTDIAANHEQLRRANGYDHCWVIDGTGLRSAAMLHDPASGRTLELLTDQPGVQVYTGNWLGGTGKGGVQYRPRSGICLEPQRFPDSPNIPEFPAATLRPGEVYKHTSVLRFGTR